MVNNLQTPLISVLMTVFNREDYLREAIESVLVQTFQDFEFIIVDDGSTDSSLSTIKSYNDNRIKIIENGKNLGISASINKALRLARGKFIARMDSDDICFPYRFEKQIAFLNDNPSLCICGGGLIYFGRSEHVLNAPINSKDIFTQLFFGPCFAQVTVMIKRDTLIDNSLYYDESLLVAEDYDLWVRLLKIALGGNLTIPLVKCRSHNENISLNKQCLAQENAMLVRLKYLRQTSSSGYTDLELQMIADAFGPRLFTLDDKSLDIVERFLLELDRGLNKCSDFYRPIGIRQIKAVFTAICVSNSDLGGAIFIRAYNSLLFDRKSYSLVRLFIKCLVPSLLLGMIRMKVEKQLDSSKK